MEMKDIFSTVGIEKESAAVAEEEYQRNDGRHHTMDRYKTLQEAAALSEVDLE